MPSQVIIGKYLENERLIRPESNGGRNFSGAGALILSFLIGVLECD